MTSATASSISSLLLAAGLTIGCERTTPIDQIHREIRAIHGRVVSTRGKVTHAAGFFGRSLYRLTDSADPRGTGVVVYGAQSAAPTVGANVSIRGLVCQFGVVQSTQLIMLFENAPSKPGDPCDLSGELPINWWSLLSLIIGRWLAA